jgi:hypothetical protein
MWIQQGPIIGGELVTKIRASGWVLEKSEESGESVFSQQLHRKIFMISVSTSNKCLVYSVSYFKLN